MRSVYLIGVSSLKYTKRSHNSATQTAHENRQRRWRKSSQSPHTNGPSAREKMPRTSLLREMQTKTMRHQLTPTRTAGIFKNRQEGALPMMWAQRKPLPWGDENCAGSLQTVGVGASSKSETESLGGLAMTLAGMHLRQLKTGHRFWSSGWEDAEACSSTRTPPTPCSLWGGPR